MGKIRRLVIIDADPATRTFLRNLTEAAGWWVDHDSSPEGVWHTLPDADVVLMGLHLRDGTGIESLVRMRSLGFTMPAVFLAAEVDREVEQSIRAAGATLLVEPIDPMALIQTIDTICPGQTDELIDLTALRDPAPQRATSAS